MRQILIPNNHTHTVSEVCNELISLNKKETSTNTLHRILTHEPLFSNSFKEQGHDVWFSNRSIRKGLEKEKHYRLVKRKTSLLCFRHL